MSRVNTENQYMPTSMLAASLSSTNNHELQDESSPNDNRIKQINIEQLDYGFILRVGCQTVAIEEKETLLRVLGKYIENPSRVESNWYKFNGENKLNNI